MSAAVDGPIDLDAPAGEGPLWGIASAALMGLMSRQVAPTEQGQLQGANASLMGIANLIGPGVFTLVWMFTHVGQLDHWLYQGGFAVVALVTMLVIAMAVHPASRLMRRGLGIRPLRCMELARDLAGKQGLVGG